MLSKNDKNYQKKCMRCEGQYKLASTEDFLIFEDKKFLQVRDLMDTIDLKGMQYVMPYSICEECVNIFVHCYNLTRCDCIDKAVFPFTLIHLDNYAEEFEKYQGKVKIDENLNRDGKKDDMD